MAGSKNKLQIWEEIGEDKQIASRLFMLASEGLTRDKIRKELKIGITVWQRMVQQEDSYPIYMNALRKGEIIGTEKVVEALKNRALGYEYTEVTNDDLRGQKTTVKHIAADVGAIKYYLNNVDSKNWSDKKVIEQNVTTTTKELNYEEMSPAAIREILIAAGRVQALPAEIKEVKSDDPTE